MKGVAAVGGMKENQKRRKKIHFFFLVLENGFHETFSFVLDELRSFLANSSTANSTNKQQFNCKCFFVRKHDQYQ